MHGALFAELAPGARQWLRGLGEAIGKGEMNEDELVSAVTRRSAPEPIKHERSIFHACFLSLAVFEREIAGLAKEIEEFDRQISELEGRVSRGDAQSDIQAKKLSEAREERERRMVILNSFLSKKSNATQLFSDILKSAGKSDQDIIKNLK